jgi:hypothetical protein
MANEVVISERALPSSVSKQGNPKSPYGERVTTQVIDAGSKSAALDNATEAVLITANGADIWYKIGGSSVSAAANTAGNEFLAADQSRLEIVTAGQYIDTAANS